MPLASFWGEPNASSALYLKIFLGAVLGIGAVIGLMYAPRSLRKPIIFTVTFLGGLYYILHYLWPTPQDYSDKQIPNNWVEGVGFWLQGSLPTVSAFTQALGSLLLGLGISSLLRIHVGQLTKRHRDWFFSLTFIIGMLLMLVFGLWDWGSRLPPGADKAFSSNPLVFPHLAKDFLFDGLLVNLDAVVFSIIAFFIFSAAYRAFRVRSIESTVLLGTALIIMLSLMGGAVLGWDSLVDGVGRMFGASPNGFIENFRMTEFKSWVQNCLQTPSLRAMEFGLAIGFLAINLRLWLGIEKGVSS